MMNSCFIEGNEAIAWGAKAAGCNFFAGYPITPATTIYNTMLDILPPDGGICMQGEDEIASIGLCLGASMAGMKTMTATSGPGISLYSEHISFAIGSEIPLVIVDIQRLGPSTGSATRGADGDIQFLRWGNSGGLPVIVLAPTDVKDCYTLTQKAFNLAEIYRCPVFVASNKEIGMTRENIDLSSLEAVEVLNRKIAPEDKPYIPFQTTGKSNVPDFLPLGCKTLVRQTSSTHGPDGYITSDASVITAMQNRLKSKLDNSVNDFSYYEYHEAKEARTLVITYGVSARAAKEACTGMTESGKPVSLLVLKTLWPVPEKVIKEKALNIQKIVVVEMNLGQYVFEIERILPGKAVSFVGKMDGLLITPKEIMEAASHE